MMRPLVLLLAALPLLAAEPPRDFGPLGTYNAVTLPDGTLESFHRRALGGKVRILRVRYSDGGRTASAPEPIHSLPVEPWGGVIPLVARDGELHFVISKVRGEGRKPNVDRFIDLYHMCSTDGRTKWTEPQRIYEGYCGSLQGVFQLKRGRIIAPFADWLPGVPTAPPSGPSVTTCVYSDDLGRTWTRSPSKLTSPCHDGANLANYGACEPTILELRDGRVWMLIRTQDGFLYESFSKDGAEWEPARRSRFHSSNSPAFPIRLADGRVVVFWNNADHCPRLGKEGVYSGRDALHAAISEDDGGTWRGFREVYRDPTRSASPPKDGDRGTAYPHATLTDDGKKILLVSGQGANLRRRILVDPDWLLETSQAEPFASLDAWHVYKGVGPAKRFWRDRVQGPQLIAHPDRPDTKVLHLRRPDENDADGAVWNFPAAKSGEVTLRLRLEQHAGGAQINLMDFMLDPCDETAAARSRFTLTIPEDGHAGQGFAMTQGQWHTLKLAWNTGEICTVSLDGGATMNLKAQAPSPDGLSYLRLRSLAESPEAGGFLIESVHMESK